MKGKTQILIEKGKLKHTCIIKIIVFSIFSCIKGLLSNNIIDLLKTKNHSWYRENHDDRRVFKKPQGRP
jgi:hypothetical protein